MMWILLLVVVVSSSRAAQQPAMAQGPAIDWSQPINLSNSPQSSGRPAIVADGFGYVHVFWSEEVGGQSILDIPKQLINNGNTIFYTRWDGVSWTSPVDILVVPGELVSDYIAVTVDSENRLHAVWTGQTNFYYSSAPSWRADSAHAWSEPVVVATDSARSQWESDIVVDSSGDVHIAYAARGDQAGIYHTLSSDNGITWQLPTRLSEPFTELEVAYSTVMIIADPANRLHVVWQTHQQEGFGQAVYYARSTDGGRSWTPPVRIAYRDPGEYGVGFPYIAAVGGSELHLIYIDGAWHVGRWHRISQDGGATWSAPSHILQNLEGINGYTIPLVDGAEGLHLVVTMRTLAQVGGLFYARWSGSGWSPEQLAIRDTLQTGPGAHWTAATFSRGNEIHVVWNTNFSSKAGEIWYARGQAPGVPSGQIASVPTADELAPSEMTPGTPTPLAADAAPSAAPVVRSSSQNLPAPPMASSSPGLLLAITSLPALLLIAGAMAWTRIRSR